MPRWSCGSRPGPGNPTAQWYEMSRHTFSVVQVSAQCTLSAPWGRTRSCWWYGKKRMWSHGRGASSPSSGLVLQTPSPGQRLTTAGVGGHPAGTGNSQKGIGDEWESIQYPVICRLELAAGAYSLSFRAFGVSTLGFLSRVQCLHLILQPSPHPPQTTLPGWVSVSPPNSNHYI